MSAQPKTPAGLPVKSPDRFFIGGKWEKPAGKATLDVISPVTEEVVITFPEASPADVDKAVAAATAERLTSRLSSTMPYNVRSAAMIKRAASANADPMSLIRVRYQHTNKGSSP